MASYDLDLAAVRSALAGYRPGPFTPMAGRDNPRRAAVLVPVVCDPRPRVIVTLRPREMPRHGGEICFPGGRPEPEDVDLWATAVREAQEELGLTVVEPLGRLTSLPLFGSDFRMEPFVAAVSGAPLRPDAREVEAVYHLDLGEILGRATVDAVPYTMEGERRLAPYFPLPDGVVMYGATALTFYELLRAVAAGLGVAPPTPVEGGLGWRDLAPKK